MKQLFYLSSKSLNNAYIQKVVLYNHHLCQTPQKCQIHHLLSLKPLDEQVEEKIIVFETECDITESSHSWSRNFIWAKYAIYFPFDKEKDEVVVRMGDLFEANMHGLIVNGKVVGVFPSQLGGVTAYIQDTDV